ncbi:sulfotransferase family protein [Palleronia aestuarii]|uniref:Sulfotransferase family protein n=1 Tax=Palleronia aestuarii TaxID=568105 RepID=A0A2W7NJU5_9RHOB|nr:sulfotransferase [Palleronia aestuarii]PZX13456.1 sulfotransferase family protein [Palleronia aestuarii]
MSAGRAEPLPDFVIVGAMKCGTSTLAAQLGAQPGVFMTEPKEPNFFSDESVFAKGMPWYQALFAAAAPGDLKGEASTHYTKRPIHPHALPRLVEALPDARLIYLIRDPVARTVSHYVHEWSQGVVTGDLETAFADHPELVEYGRYGAQIAPFVERFGAERIHVDTLEAMQADPQALLSRVGRFLGREGLAWVHDLERVNASAERLRRGRFDRVLLHSAPATWLRRALVPQSLRDRVKASRRMAEKPVLAPERRRALEAVFAEDRKTLHALFPERPDLDAAYPFVAQ